MRGIIKQNIVGVKQHILAKKIIAEQGPYNAATEV
jgi:hypothetical protein